MPKNYNKGYENIKMNKLVKSFCKSLVDKEKGKRNQEVNQSMNVLVSRSSSVLQQLSNNSLE